MTYTYLRSEPGLWTVGDYSPAGKWQPESDHDSREDAAARVAWLNGSGQPPAPAGLVLTPKDRRLLLAALADAAAHRQQRATAPCDTCLLHPADLCDHHAGDLDAAAAYRALAARLAEQPGGTR